MREVITGVCRNEPNATRHHLYVYGDDGELYPMCGYGWNRSDGTAFSIFRGHTSDLGECALCRKNLDAGKPPVTGGWHHKTRWI